MILSRSIWYSFLVFLLSRPYSHSMASIVIDNSAKQLKTGGGQWSTSFAERLFGGEATWPTFSNDENGDTGVYGTLSVNFHGTSIALFGNTPPLPASQYIYVSIDGGTLYNTSYEDPSPPTSLQWYQSPILTHANHTIDITHIAGTSVDYIVITAGSNTRLKGQRLIVDDNDSAISYEGNWAVNTGRYISSNAPSHGLPYGNSTHQTTTQGASAAFRFTGTSVDIYGLFNWQNIGTLSILYTIDGSSSTQSYDVSTSTPEYIQGLLQRENTLLYSKGSLTAGDHTLTMEVTECDNQTLALDYILYSPSFDTLATKPVFSAAIYPLPSSTILPASSVSTALPGNTTPSSNTGMNKRTQVTVGCVLGGLAGLSLLLVLYLYWERIFKRTSPTTDISRVQSPMIQPYTLTASRTNMLDNYIYPIPQRKQRIPVSAPPATSLEISSRSATPSSTGTPQSTYTSSTAALVPFPARDNSHLQQQDEDTINESRIPATGILFRGRMRRLQDLVAELNNEMAENGDQSPKVVELRGRIAELMREDAENIGIVIDGGRQRTTIPPPYELRR